MSKSTSKQQTDMKKIILLLSLLLPLLSSCFDADINRNKYEITGKEKERENYNIGSTLVGMQSMVNPSQEHLHQFMESMVGGEYGGYFEGIVTWASKFSTFNPEVSWQKAPFTDNMTDTYSRYFDLLSSTDDEVALAIGKVLRVGVMHRLADLYGPIPYTELLKDGKPSGSLRVKYDSQEEAYRAMFRDLEEADAVLELNKDMSVDGFRKLDNVYYGDLKKWMKYLHSLQLRLAMRLSYVLPTEAQQIAEKAFSRGVIEANSDNALFHVEENRSEMIYNLWGDHRVSANILSYMRGYKDPRMEKMFVKGMKVVTADSVVYDYYGVRNGIHTTDKDKMVNLYSKHIINVTDPFLWMNAAEVTFLRAEGALRGWNMGGTAKSLYQLGVTLSFEERGATGVSAYLQDKVLTQEAYNDPLYEYSTPAVSDITIAWDDDADFERNLERIITQKYIAIFPLGIEAWSEHRRTGYPKFFPVATNNDPQGSVDVNFGARRLPYPPEEYVADRDNVNAAVQLLGGKDAYGTRVWWDVKP
jgi:hypothetical protein